MRRKLLPAIAVFAPLLYSQQQCVNGGCASVTQSRPLAALAPSPVSNLTFFKSYVLNGDYVVAGVGVRGSGRGTISMSEVPSGAQVTAAYLYWETLGNGQTGTFNGRAVSGIRLGTVTSPCWSPPLIDVYRADVTSYLNIAGNGNYSVAFPDSSDFNVAPSTEGAALVIVYRRTDLSSKAVVIYDGAYTQAPGTPTFDLTLQGFTRASASSPSAKITHIVGDGQSFTETLAFNGTTLSSPTNPFGGFQGQLWDNPTFDVSSLVSPNAVSVNTSVRWPNVGNISNDCLTWGAVVFSTTIDSGAASTELLDPVSELLSGANITTPTTQANLTTLATKGTPRKGIAADGVAQLVVRFNAPSAGRVIFSLSDENGVVASRTDIYGSLTDLFGQPLSGIVSTSTYATGQGNKIWARYTAPRQFVRDLSFDGNISQRIVFVNIRFIPNVGPPQDLSPIPISIVRPPVMLVHGLWSDETAWSGFPLTSSRDCADSNNGNYYVCRLDYKDHHADKFGIIAPIVGQQIRDNVAKFKTAKNVAAIQASVIGHSMGGLIPRVLPLCGSQFDCVSYSYRISANYNAGEIFRLLTIGSPHQGTVLANDLWNNKGNRCCLVLSLFCKGTLESRFAEADSSIGGGVEDLQKNSDALQHLNGVTTPFPLAFFVGISSSNDRTLLNQGLFDAIKACGVTLDAQTVFGEDNDLIVPVTSQRYGLTDGVDGTTNYSTTIHAKKGIVWNNQMGFSLQELDFAQLGADVVKALDVGVFTNK